MAYQSLTAVWSITNLRFDSPSGESLPVFAHSGNRLAYYCLLKTNDNEGAIYSTAMASGSPTLVRETVYFVKNGRASTINAVPLKSEGAVTAVKGMPAVSDQSLWTVVPEGIYFAPMEAPTSVQYFDFATKHVRRSCKFEKNFANGLSVSPDGRWLLYTQVDKEISDIMLVENFR